MKQLNEKVAIVTGAGQGIGKGIALCLAKRGVKVIATGRRPDPINQTIAEIKEAGGEGFAMTCDSADRERVLLMLLLTTPRPLFHLLRLKKLLMTICLKPGRVVLSVLLTICRQPFLI